MRSYAFLFFLLISLTSIFGQKSNPAYDAELAKKYEADDFGMKSYVFVMLKSGTNKSTNTAARDSCFAGHMTNIGKLVEEGKLIIAGPLQTNPNQYRGIFIFDVPSIEEVEKLLQTDPAINAKYLDADLYEWYGSAALAAYLPVSDKIWKTGF